MGMGWKSMELNIVDESDVDVFLDQKIRNGLCVCFPEDVSVFSQTRAWHCSAPAWSVIMKEREKIIAHCGVVDRTIKAGEVPIRIAGIQNVFVLPDHRGKGLCDKVMNKAMEEAERRQYECGLLFCVPELEKVYARCGWKLLPRENVYRIDENGEVKALPEKNIAMFHPLKRTIFPPGDISLEGNDW
jgi:predicted N-acetyltransferase YhbS